MKNRLQALCLVLLGMGAQSATAASEGYVYGRSDSCSSGARIATVTLDTVCSDYSSSIASWSIKVDNQCIKVGDLNAPLSCDRVIDLLDQRPSRPPVDRPGRGEVSEREFNRLVRQVSQLEDRLLRLERRLNNDDDFGHRPTGFGCSLSTGSFNNRNYAVGRTKQEAIYRVNQECENDGVPFCERARIECEEIYD